MSSKLHISNSEHSFKSKWNQMVYKFNTNNNTDMTITSSLSCHQENNNNNYRRPSHCSDQSTCSTKTTDSNTSITTIDKFFSIFKRRCSNTTNQQPSCTMEEITLTPSITPGQMMMEFNEEKESARMDQLYQIAMDEISYAEDSQGSRYYHGDIISAKEAMDDCAQAIVSLLHQVSDRQLHDHLHATLTPKLLSLQSRFDALPTVDP
ncbi:unnamed protein product [Cunninghamella blakesleeana]